MCWMSIASTPVRSLPPVQWNRTGWLLLSAQSSSSSQSVLPPSVRMALYIRTIVAFRLRHDWQEPLIGPAGAARQEAPAQPALEAAAWLCLNGRLHRHVRASVQTVLVEQSWHYCTLSIMTNSAHGHLVSIIT